MSNFDDNVGSSPYMASAHGSRNSDEEPHSSDEIKAWDIENDHLFSV